MTIPILVEQLKDDNAGIRWAASTALVGLRREGLSAIFTALVHDFDSIGFRQSVHHILHVLKDDGELTDAEEKVSKPWKVLNQVRLSHGQPKKSSNPCDIKKR
jgi:hypothetical protein